MIIIEKALKNTLPEDYYYGIGSSSKVKHSFLQPLLDISSKYFSFDDAKSYEYWQRDFKDGAMYSLDWHIDYDTKSFDNDKLVTPIFSLVYYPFISGMVGGEICFEDEAYKPKENSLVLFDPCMWHKVNSGFCKRRTSFMLNVYKEEGVKHHSYNSAVVQDTWVGIKNPKEIPNSSLEKTKKLMEKHERR